MPDLQGSRPRRFSWRPYVVSLVLILGLSLAPIASVLAAALLARSHGCRLDEGNVYPCMILGADWGGILNAMSVLGWLMLATLPAGAIALLIWLAVLLINVFRHRRS